MTPLVEVRLNHFVYRFRPLTWKEAARIQPAAGEGPRDVMLALALADVSGRAITSPEDARAVVRKIPKTLRSRIWIVYRGNLPEDRYFSSADLYIAPEFQMFNRQLIDAREWMIVPRHA